MSTTYDPNIPNPNHAPSQDVSVMQTNAGSISTWANNYDHFGLNNVANSGLHRQVTLPNANTPSGPPFIPTVFTLNDAFAVAQLRFYTGTAAQSSNQYTAGTTGSVLLFAGVILKWGVQAGPSVGVNNQVTVTFANPFPHGGFVAIATGNNNARTFNTVTVGTTTALFSASASMGGGDFLMWIAIGN